VSKELKEVACWDWNTLVELLTLTDPERHNAQSYRWTDGQTDDIMMPV